MKKTKVRNFTWVVVVLILLALIASVCLYYYDDAKNEYVEDPSVSYNKASSTSFDSIAINSDDYTNVADLFDTYHAYIPSGSVQATASFVYYNRNGFKSDPTFNFYYYVSSGSIEVFFDFSCSFSSDNELLVGYISDGLFVPFASATCHNGSNHTRTITFNQSSSFDSTKELVIYDTSAYSTSDSAVYDVAFYNYDYSYIDTLYVCSFYDAEDEVYYVNPNPAVLGVVREGYTLTSWLFSDSTTTAYNRASTSITCDTYCVAVWTIKSIYKVTCHFTLKSTDLTTTYIDYTEDVAKNLTYNSSIDLEEYVGNDFASYIYSKYVANGTLDWSYESFALCSLDGYYLDSELENKLTTLEITCPASNVDVYVRYVVDPSVVSSYELNFDTILDEYTYYSYQASLLNVSDSHITTTNPSLLVSKDIYFYSPYMNVYSKESITFLHYNEGDTNAYIGAICYTCYNTQTTWRAPVIQYSRFLTAASSDIANLSFLFNSDSGVTFGDNDSTLFFVIDANYWSYNFYLVDVCEPVATYELIFNLNGGEFIEDCTRNAYLGADGLIVSSSINNVDKQYYDFDGWYLDISFTKPISSKISFYEDNVAISSGYLNLYAKYSRSVVYITYKVVGDNDLSDDEYLTASMYAGKFSPAINFTTAYRNITNDSTATAFKVLTAGLIDVFHIADYVFLGWSYKETNYEDWETYSQSKHPALLSAAAIITSNKTVYACFYCKEKDLSVQFWAWDNLNFKAIETDDTLPNAMIDALADAEEGQVGLFFAVVIDTEGGHSETVIFETLLATDGDEVLLPTCDEFVARVKGVLTTWCYKLIGWSETPSEIGIWDSITGQTKDFEKFKITSNTVTASTNKTYYAVCCLDTVYSSVIANYDIWNQRDGFTIDNDLPVWVSSALSKIADMLGIDVDKLKFYGKIGICVFAVLVVLVITFVILKKFGLLKFGKQNKKNYSVSGYDK